MQPSTVVVAMFMRRCFSICIILPALCTQVFCFRVCLLQANSTHELSSTRGIDGAHGRSGTHCGSLALNKPLSVIDHAVLNHSSPAVEQAILNYSSPTKRTAIHHKRHVDVRQPSTKHLDVKFKFMCVVFAGCAILLFVVSGFILFHFRRKAKRNKMKVEETKKDVREAQEKETVHIDHLDGRWHNLKLLCLWIACMLMNCNYSFSNQFSAYRQSLQETYHLSDATAGSVYTAMNTGALFFSFVPGWLFDRYGLAVSSAFSAAVSVYSILLLRFNLATWWVPFCFFLFGFAQTCFQVVGLVGVLSTFPETYAGTAAAALILCISLGVTVQSLVFDKVYHKKWELYQQYIILYSLVTAALGMMASMLVKGREHPSLSVQQKAEAAFDANQVEREREDPAELECTAESEDEEDEINEICETATELFAHSEMMAHMAPAGSGLERPKLRYQLVSLPFAFMVLVHCIDLAFGFSLLGAVATAAMSVGMDEQQVPAFVAMLGLVGSVGRLLLGMTSDIMVRYSKVFNRYFYFLVAYLLYTVSLIVLLIWPKLLPVCACVCIFSWGGTMSLAPGTIRAEFGAKLAGRLYGLLHTMLSFTFTLWDCKVPDSPRACFSSWFSAAAIAMSVNLVASFLMWVRSMRTDGTLSTK